MKERMYSMQDKEIKPHIDRLKKDPSMNEILNFTQAILKKLPESEKTTDNSQTDNGNKSNAETINSLVTAAQSFINPTTLSLLSRTLNQTEIKKDDSNSSTLKLKVEQLSAELSEVKEELNHAKIQLAEKSQRLEELETSVQYLKRRRRRR
jgi:DNA repair ATPase RecN